MIVSPEEDIALLSLGHLRNFSITRIKFWRSTMHGFVLIVIIIYV